MRPRAKHTRPKRRHITYKKCKKRVLFYQPRLVVFEIIILITHTSAKYLGCSWHFSFSVPDGCSNWMILFEDGIALDTNWGDKNQRSCGFSCSSNLLIQRLRNPGNISLTILLSRWGIADLFLQRTKKVLYLGEILPNSLKLQCGTNLHSYFSRQRHG